MNTVKKFTERINANYAECKEELFKTAQKFSDYETAYRLIKSNMCELTNTDMECLLEFKNPLAILADYCKPRTCEYETFDEFIDLVLSDDELAKTYPLVSDDFDEQYTIQDNTVYILLNNKLFTLPLVEIFDSLSKFIME